MNDAVVVVDHSNNITSTCIQNILDVHGRPTA